jgi:hypothetical protein
LVPDYQTVDQDPAWHRYLLGIDSLSGRVRQQLLNEAINMGRANRVAAFFNGFKQQQGQAYATSVGARSNPSGRVFTNDSIRAMYEHRRKGGYTDQEWQALEAELAQALKTGQVHSKLWLTK